MPTTRKKVIKTIYKDEDDSDEGVDFSDSGSDAKISDYVSTEDEEEPEQSSSNEFKETTAKKTKSKPAPQRMPQFPKNFVKKLANQASKYSDVQGNSDYQNNSKFEDEDYVASAPISVKDLTEADKQLPAFLNLSESDSSDEEAPTKIKINKMKLPSTSATLEEQIDTETPTEYKDIWSVNLQNSEEIAQKAFKELEQHKNIIDAAKSSLQSYESSIKPQHDFDVSDLLAQGEVSPSLVEKKKEKSRKVRKGDSDSEMEDWEEVQESKEIPHQGIELVVEIPDAVRRKTKKLDIEMMMKRRINRAKKEQQVFIHKVHVLCWIAHGNYVSKILNSRKIMAAALSLVPSKDCYPKQRVDIKYVEQIVTWFKDKLTLKQDKNEHKFKPKAPPLNEILLEQIKNKVVTSKRYQVFIFVAMLRALGLQCRITFNFIAAPLKPPSSELCSLSTKSKDEKKDDNKTKENQSKSKQKCSKKKPEPKKIAQVDGVYDSSFDSNSESDVSYDTDTEGDDSTNERDVNYDINTESESIEIESVENTDSFDSSFIEILYSSNTDSECLDLDYMRNVDKPFEKVDEHLKEIDDDFFRSLEKRDDVCNSSSSDTDFDMITQLDGNDDTNVTKTRTRRNKTKNNEATDNNEDISPPKRTRKSPTPKHTTAKDKNSEGSSAEPAKRISSRNKKTSTCQENADKPKDSVESAPSKRTRKCVSPISTQKTSKESKQLKKKFETKEVEKQSTDKKECFVDEKIPNKRAKKSPSPMDAKSKTTESVKKNTSRRKADISELNSTEDNSDPELLQPLNKDPIKAKPSPRKTRSSASRDSKNDPPKITITNENNISSIYFGTEKPKVDVKRLSLSRNRSKTTNLENKDEKESSKTKTRTKSVPNNKGEQSKYFDNTDESKTKQAKTSKATDKIVQNESKQKNNRKNAKKDEKVHTPEKSKYFNVKQEIKSPKYSKSEEVIEDGERVSHRDLWKSKINPKNDVSGDLVKIIKKRVREAKADTRKRIVKGKLIEESDDSDYLPEETPNRRRSSEDFKPSKISPNTSKISQKANKINPKSKKIDRRVLSTDVEELPKNKMDVWCEVFVEEIEEWVSVDVLKAQVHCAQEIYNRATHPVCYVVGWDNSNFLKDITRRYVPHWNTQTRKLRAESSWWEEAIRPWMGPKTRRDRQEDDNLDRMQLDAPLPTSIGEYKNHPLYALKRHLLKFEAIYPPDAATLGFVRNEAVYARECVYVCRSRESWLKEAKVVKLGEQPYKIVKARPKWDRLSNKMITDKPLEVFGPWQCQDYEPPTAENGIVPRNAYGNVELFKDCMLPKGTVHIKLPGLNKVAKKLNIDCAPAMTGFDFNGGWSHPVYDGYVVCQEYQEIITEAWVKEQEEQERKEQEKIELRVYGNWKRLIKGLLIRERLKDKYGFDNPTTSHGKKGKGPKFVVKKK